MPWRLVALGVEHVPLIVGTHIAAVQQVVGNVEVAVWREDVRGEANGEEIVSSRDGGHQASRIRDGSEQIVLEVAWQDREMTQTAGDSSPNEQQQRCQHCEAPNRFRKGTQCCRVGIAWWDEEVEGAGVLMKQACSKSSSEVARHDGINRYHRDVRLPIESGREMSGLLLIPLE